MTRSCGSLFMKPTVSDSIIFIPLGRVTFLTTVSSVAKSIFSASTSAPVSALSNVLLPAFVYPTSATIGVAFLSLDSLLKPRCFSILESSSSSSNMRLLILRLSISSFFSPGPLVPIPPPSLESASPCPNSLGNLYLSCASSTCSLPSLDCALDANMSSINVVRSITDTPSICSRFRCCIAVSSSSNMNKSASCSLP